MKEYIEERAVAIANYIIDHNATVRQTAKKFGISKSTVHKLSLIHISVPYGHCGNYGECDASVHLQLCGQDYTPFPDGDH